MYIKNYPYLLGATEQLLKDCGMMNKNLFKDEESYQQFEKYVFDNMIKVCQMEQDYSAKHPNLYP